MLNRYMLEIRVFFKISGLYSTNLDLAASVDREKVKEAAWEWEMKRLQPEHLTDHETPEPDPSLF